MKKIFISFFLIFFLKNIPKGIAKNSQESQEQEKKAPAVLVVPTDKSLISPTVNSAMDKALERFLALPVDLPPASPASSPFVGAFDTNSISSLPNISPNILFKDQGLEGAFLKAYNPFLSSDLAGYWEPYFEFWPFNTFSQKWFSAFKSLLSLPTCFYQWEGGIEFLRDHKLLPLKISIPCQEKELFLIPAFSLEKLKEVVGGGPVGEEESLEKILLVQKNEGIEQVEIDVAYKQKILLNSKGERTLSLKETKYFLFTSVLPGTIFISYKALSEKIGDKERAIDIFGQFWVQHPQMASFINPEITTEVIKFSFFEKNPLGASLTPLVLTPYSEMTLEGSVIPNFSFEREGPSSYKISNLLYVKKTPLYLKIKRNYGFNSTYVVLRNKTEENSFVLDSFSLFDYIEKTYLEVSDYKKNSLIQFNFFRPVKEVEFLVNYKDSSASLSGQEIQKIIFLGEDGSVYEGYKSDFGAEKIIRAYVVLKGQGVLNTKIEYLDTTIPFSLVETLFSQNSFILESL